MYEEIHEAIKTLEDDISIKKEQIAKLKDFTKLSANGLSEDQYHEFCETNLRYTDLLGKVLVKNLPFLTYERRGANNFFYTLEGQKVFIPNSLCYGVELHLQKVYVSPENEKNRIMKDYTSIKEHREEKIATREAYLATKNLIKKARIIFPTYRPVIAMIKYLFKAPFKHYRTEIKKQLEELIQLNQRAETSLNEKIKTIDFEYEKQQAFFKKYVPLFLEWTQTEVRVYNDNSQIAMKYKLKDGKIERLEH